MPIVASSSVSSNEPSNYNVFKRLSHAAHMPAQTILRMVSQYSKHKVVDEDLDGDVNDEDENNRPSSSSKPKRRVRTPRRNVRASRYRSKHAAYGNANASAYKHKDPCQEELDMKRHALCKGEEDLDWNNDIYELSEEKKEK
ncbi:hypothetical protein FRC09_020303 [Ceratobasidium sp. 395]|nr:hypothetical protein FRC09_020303 [Ceratobasidium sp. 395]